MIQPQVTNPFNPAGAPPPATPAAAFIPVSPQPQPPQNVISLVPPIASPTPGEGVRHPDPIVTLPVAPPKQQTRVDVPIAPVRPRLPVTPLIASAPGVPLQNALAVAPLIPGMQSPGQQHGGFQYGGFQSGGYPAMPGMPQPTSFPFYSAQPVSAPQPFAIPQPYMPAYAPAPGPYGSGPSVAPVQTFIAVITLYPMPATPPAAYMPQPFGQQYAASQYPFPQYTAPQYQFPQHAAQPYGAPQHIAFQPQMQGQPQAFAYPPAPVPAQWPAPQYPPPPGY